jgi:predicted O-methyltransferase YrrM
MYFPPQDIEIISYHLEERFTRSFFDTCFEIEGMTSVKKQMLLRIAFSSLPPEECYVEIGTYTGKSLISAAKGNLTRRCYACDNFSEFQATNSYEILLNNLRRHGMVDRVTFFDADFKSILLKFRTRV